MEKKNIARYFLVAGFGLFLCGIVLPNPLGLYFFIESGVVFNVGIVVYILTY